MRVPRSSRPLAMLADSQDLTGAWALGASGAFLISAAGAGAITFLLYRTTQLTWISALTGLVMTVVAHQAVHALAMWAVRGHPRLVWTFRHLVPSMHVGSATRLSRRQALIEMLAPLVVIDLAGLALLLLPATAGVGLAIVVANTTGSVPDLWRAYRLARFPRWVRCDQRGATMLIWAPAEYDRTVIRARHGRAPGAPTLVGVLGTWVLCLLVAEALCAGGARLVAQWDGTLTVAGVLLASTEQFVSGPDVVLNFMPVLVGGAALGTLAAAVWVLIVQVAPRTRRPPEPRRAVAYRNP